MHGSWLRGGDRSAPSLIAEARRNLTMEKMKAHYHSLEGEAEFAFAGKIHRVGPGELVFFPSHVTHAETRFLTPQMKYLVIRTMEPGDDPCCSGADLSAQRPWLLHDIASRLGPLSPGSAVGCGIQSQSRRPPKCDSGI